MSRLDLFENALEQSRRAFESAPHMFPLRSVISQLEFLRALESGETADAESLGTICIGEIAARDIDEFDEDLGNLLHDVSFEVRKMQNLLSP